MVIVRFTHSRKAKLLSLLLALSAGSGVSHCMDKEIQRVDAETLGISSSLIAQPTPIQDRSLVVSPRNNERPQRSSFFTKAKGLCSTIWNSQPSLWARGHVKNHWTGRIGGVDPDFNLKSLFREQERQIILLNSIKSNIRKYAEISSIDLSGTTTSSVSSSSVQSSSSEESQLTSNKPYRILFGTNEPNDEGILKEHFDNNEDAYNLAKKICLENKEDFISKTTTGDILKELLLKVKQLKKTLSLSHDEQLKRFDQASAQLNNPHSKFWGRAHLFTEVMILLLVAQGACALIGIPSAYGPLVLTAQALQSLLISTPCYLLN